MLTLKTHQTHIFTKKNANFENLDFHQFFCMSHIQFTKRII